MASTPVSSPPSCEHCSARDASVFLDLPANELSVLSNAKSCRTYRKGQTVFFADDYPGGLFCLHNGKVKIYKLGSDGKEQIVRLARTGDIVGYRSLISGGPYSAYAVPLEDSQICFIPRALFFSMLSTNANLSMRVLELLSTELRAAEDRLVEMAQKPVRERLAEALILLKETYGLEDDGATLNVKVTREELGNIVGTATESVIRILSEMKQHNVVDFVGRRIKIVNQKALLEIANVDD